MILRLTAHELDLSLLPATLAGVLTARYNAGNGAIEYRDGARLLALTVSGRHYSGGEL